MLWTAPVEGVGPFREALYIQNETYTEAEGWLHPAEVHHSGGALPPDLEEIDGQLPGADLPGRVEEISSTEDEDYKDVTPQMMTKWKAQLSKFHRAAGQPTSRNLARMLTDAKVDRWKVKEAFKYRCHTCEEQKPGGKSSKQVPPISLRPLPQAWEHLGIDIGEWEVPTQNLKVKFILMMDMATHYRVTKVLASYPHGETYVETPNDVIKSIIGRWLMDKPRPKILNPGNANTLISQQVSKLTSDLGIAVMPHPDTESWAHGVVERNIGHLKKAASRIHKSTPDLEPGHAIALATAALNSTEFVQGYSSIQWAFGHQATLGDDELRQRLSPCGATTRPISSTAHSTAICGRTCRTCQSFPDDFQVAEYFDPTACADLQHGPTGDDLEEIPSAHDLQRNYVDIEGEEPIEEDDKTEETVLDDTAPAEPDLKKFKADEEDDPGDGLYLDLNQAILETNEAYVIDLELVVYRKLSEEDRKLFDHAKASEISSFEQLQFDGLQQRKLYERSNLTECFVPDGYWFGSQFHGESKAEALQERQSKPDSSLHPSGDYKAKARIVVLGFEHPDLVSSTFRPSLQQLAALQEAGVPFLLVDAMTDCKDLYSLTTGRTALPQDKSQRVYILAHREARLCGRLRWIILVPTQSMVADALTKPMLSRQLLHLLSTGQVIFVNEDGHPLEARRLPPVIDFTEDDLVEGDEKWINHMMTPNDIKTIQNYATSRTRTSRRRGIQRTEGTDLRDDCRLHDDGHGDFVPMEMCEKDEAVLLEDDTFQMMQPLSRADLVNRMLAAENNVMELQLQLNENVKDINILYRSMRRSAGPHPEEPSSSRPRTIDRRPAQPEPDGELGTAEGEPEIERAFNDAASRSRDTSGDSGEQEPQGQVDSYGDDVSLDAVTRDLNEFQRRDRRMRNRLHIMNIESNNMEVYLYTMVQVYGPDYVVPLTDIMQLYEDHAPSMEAPGDYCTSERMLHQHLPDGSWRFTLLENSEQYGEQEHHFVSQCGLYGFRNRRIIARENDSLMVRERDDRIENLYSHYRLYTG
eukprot:s416_g8.t1